MKRKSRSLGEDEGMNMTPMIDVVFLLIIFFMIVIDLSQQELENIVLPRASECSEDSEPPEFRKIINVRDDGMVIVKRKELGKAGDDPTKLRADLSEWKRQGQTMWDQKPNDFCEKPILIRTDRGTEMKHVQHIMKLCGEQALRIWKVELACSGDIKGQNYEDPLETPNIDELND